MGVEEPEPGMRTFHATLDSGVHERGGLAEGLVPLLNGPRQLGHSFSPIATDIVRNSETNQKNPKNQRIVLLVSCQISGTDSKVAIGDRIDGIFQTNEIKGLN